MCEQTEVNYLDGDVVWVKLGPSWWPGQVVGLKKLPEDVQSELLKKPIIAAVKFFQEESFEFVKNYQQIYKYNCTLKEDFIKKGLDKYRAKSKEGSNYMNKFPEDVKTAEILLNGDPDILTKEKFNPQKKPDISGLFGERKIAKKKRSKEDSMKKHDIDIKTKVVHPSIMTKKDHEIRVRQQTSTTISTNSNNSSFGTTYPCHICGFIATRVNVIICHLKSHRFSNETTITKKLKSKVNIQSKLKISNFTSSRRRNIKKSLLSKNENDIGMGSSKRKQHKQDNKPNKKKKSDHELRERLLADWNIDSDEDEITNFEKSTNTSCKDSSNKTQSSEERLTTVFLGESHNSNELDNTSILQESNALLEETDNYIDFSNLSNLSINNLHKVDQNEKEEDRLDHSLLQKRAENLHFKKTAIEKSLAEDDRKARLSCFDFDEDEVFEPNISSARKIPRNLGSKSMSLKKEIIKEFEMSQALNDETILSELKHNEDVEENSMSNIKLIPKQQESDGKKLIVNEANEKANSNIMHENKLGKTEVICETQVEILEFLEIEKDTGKNLENNDTIADIKIKNEKQQMEKLTDDEAMRENPFLDKKKKNDSLYMNKQTPNFETVEKISEESFSSQNNLFDMKNTYLKSEKEEHEKCTKGMNKTTSFVDVICSSQNKTLNEESSDSPIIEENESNSSLDIKQDGHKMGLNIIGMEVNIDSSIKSHIKMDNDLSENSEKSDVKVESIISTKYKSISEEVTEKSENLKSLPAINSLNENSFVANTDGNSDKSNLDIETFFNKYKNEKSTLIKNQSDDEIICNQFSKESNENEQDTTSTNSTCGKIQSIISKDEKGFGSKIEDLTQLKIKHPKWENSEPKTKKKDSFVTLDNNIFSSSSKFIVETKCGSEENLYENFKEVQDRDSGMTNILKNIDSGTQNERKILEKHLESTFEINATQLNNDSVDKCISDKCTKFEKELDDCQFDFVENNSIKRRQMNILNAEIEEKQKEETIETELNYKENIIESEDQTNKSISSSSLTAENSEISQIVASGIGQAQVILCNNASIINDQNSAHSATTIALSAEKNNLTNITKTIVKSISASEITVPVKKREKPRIIENVTLKEPMIFKTKLMDKHSIKIGKHKLENSTSQLYDTVNVSKTKHLKLESVTAGSNKSSNLEALISLKNNDKNEQTRGTTMRSAEVIVSKNCREKLSQSIVDMELDINSLPLVLSEEVLTPESIQQMPVVISSILPTENPIEITTSGISFSPNRPSITSSMCTDIKDVIEVGMKRKSGTPAILKSKSKAKPTITSIKTIVPPISTAAYKSIKSNTQALKSTLNSQHKVPGKYVIVQASGRQQAAYSTHQKVIIPSKRSGNAQIVQQGGKVVILTSPQSPNKKLLPITTKTFGIGKIPKIITAKQNDQIITPSNSQTIPVTSKKMLVSKNVDKESSSLTVPKIPSKKKNLSQQQIVTSKSVLSQLPGIVSKSIITRQQNIVSKEGMLTPLNAIVGRNIAMSSKNFITKGIVTQPMSVKTIVSSQGIVSKGTILTPITGSQVKALAAAKNIKGSQLQNQNIQHTVALSTVTQKKPKILSTSLSSSQNNTINIKNSNKVVVVQHPNLKIKMPNKKIVKSIQKQMPTTNIFQTPTTSYEKNKLLSRTQSHHKILNSENSKLQMKSLQKDLPENINQSNLHLKQQAPLDGEVPGFLTNDNLLEMNQVIPVNRTISKSDKKYKSELNIATNPNHSTDFLADTTLTVEEQICKSKTNEEITEHQISVGQEKLPLSQKKQDILIKEEEKAEEIKTVMIPAQTQIMAIPTENNDGTQTYVLVTVDEQGQIIPLDNNMLMSLNGTSNIDGNKTLYIDPSLLSETANIDNVILQIDNNSLSNFETMVKMPDSFQSVITGNLPSSRIMGQASNQDILAAALANTDFQHEIGVVTETATAINCLTQTNLINQTILQSTIIPPTEPISSPSVLETSLTLNQPIMTPLEIPSNLATQSGTDLTVTSCTVSRIKAKTILNTQKIEGTNQNVQTYTDIEKLSISELRNSMPLVEELKDCTVGQSKSINQSTFITDCKEELSQDQNSDLLFDNNFDEKKQHIQITSMPIIDDNSSSGNNVNQINTCQSEDNLRGILIKTSKKHMKDTTKSDSLQDDKDSVSHTMKIVSDSDPFCSSTQEVTETSDSSLSVSYISPLQNTITDVTTVIIDDLERTEAEKVKNDELLYSNDQIDPIREITLSHNKINTVKTTVLLEKSKKLTSNRDGLPVATIGSSLKPENHATNFSHEELQPLLSNEDNLMSRIKSTEFISCTQDHVIPILSRREEQITDNAEKDLQKPSISQLDQQQFDKISGKTLKISSQSNKSQNSLVMSHPLKPSLSYEHIETDNLSFSVDELPTQSYVDLRGNKTSCFEEAISEADTLTQSFDGLTRTSKNESSESIENLNFPTQSSFKSDAVVSCSPENVREREEMSRRGTEPSQSNVIDNEGLDPTLVSSNNTVVGINEDETASSSYVPETPENQERDQEDQESAISTSSYEIPPCEELNIASSTVLLSTGPSLENIESEQSSLHNNNVLGIPTSTYNNCGLNPDSSTEYVNTSSNHNDRIIVEQSDSTSYEVLPVTISRNLGNEKKESASEAYIVDASTIENNYSHIPLTRKDYYEQDNIQNTSSNLVDTHSYFSPKEMSSNYTRHEALSNYCEPELEFEPTPSNYSEQGLDVSSQQQDVGYYQGEELSEHLVESSVSTDSIDNCNDKR